MAGCLRLENGRRREELIDHLITHEDSETIVGLDFAFSFPAWWCAEQGWPDAATVWAAMAASGEALLEACEPPLWGRPGMTNPHPQSRRFRLTELDVPGAKSTFQIGGAGAVGTGSVRGMAHLGALAQAGFDIWPFGAGGMPRVIEIYPRALTGKVNKSRWRHRYDYLRNRFADQPGTLLERAAGSEDAFDAAVSALVFAKHANTLRELSPAADPIPRIEGTIWRPPEAA